ncbi:MAG: hypothetical protein PHW83_10735 [Bacteroidales bacterium]|nr:hypothetical protein [Bacteroidales bacterium]
MEEMHEYLSNIEIDGARADDDQFWRIQRIHRVIGYAQALADLDGNEKFSEKISSIYDQKGILSVEWAVKPTEPEKNYLQKAWESIVTNYESELIDHI